MKTMIVTGAGSGLGKELSLLFSQQGYHVLLTGRSADKLSTVKSEIEHAGATAEYVELNVQDESDILKKWMNSAKVTKSLV